MSLIPGLSRELTLLSVLERRFDHISAIYDLLVSCKNEELRGQSPFHPPIQRKASITTGIVERQEAVPEIQLFLNDAQVYEKVDKVRKIILNWWDKFAMLMIFEKFDELGVREEESNEANNPQTHQGRRHTVDIPQVSLRNGCHEIKN